MKVITPMAKHILNSVKISTEKAEYILTETDEGLRIYKIGQVPNMRLTVLPEVANVILIQWFALTVKKKS